MRAGLGASAAEVETILVAQSDRLLLRVEGVVTKSNDVTYVGLLWARWRLMRRAIGMTCRIAGRSALELPELLGADGDEARTLWQVIALLISRAPIPR